MTKLEITREDIAPEQAKVWLSNMASNRLVSEATVNKYVADMMRGVWKETGDPIRFNVEGKLIDGQHRLRAIMKSGITMKQAVIMRGLPVEAMDAIDSGLKRTPGNLLQIRGVANASGAAAITRLVMLYDLQSTANKVMNAISGPSILEYYFEHEDELAWAATYAASNWKKSSTPLSVLGAAVTIFRRVDAEAAAQFFHAVAGMDTDGEGDPRLALVRRLANLLRNDQRYTQQVYLDLYIRAWNQWRAGDKAIRIPVIENPPFRFAL